MSLCHSSLDPISHSRERKKWKITKIFLLLFIFTFSFSRKGGPHTAHNEQTRVCVSIDFRYTNPNILPSYVHKFSLVSFKKIIFQRAIRSVVRTENPAGWWAFAMWENSHSCLEFDFHRAHSLETESSDLLRDWSIIKSREGGFWIEYGTTTTGTVRARLNSTASNLLTR